MGLKALCRWISYLFFIFGAVSCTSPSYEGCDEYACLWRIDSIIEGDKSLKIKGNVVYLINSKKDYINEKRPVPILVKGYYTTKMIFEDFTCRGTYKFQDESIANLP